MNDAPVISSDVDLSGDQASLIDADAENQPLGNEVLGSPPASPSTPVSNQISPEVKIDVHYEDQESDAHNELLPIEPINDTQDKTSQDVLTVSEVAAELDSGPSCFLFVADYIFTISTCISNFIAGSLPPETPMETHDSNDTTAVPINDINGLNGVNGVNGVHVDSDIIMEEHTPATTPGVSGGSFSGTNGSTAHTTPNDILDDDDDKPPPAKRARVHSDADQASIAHVSLFSSCTPFLGVLIFLSPSESLQLHHHLQLPPWRRLFLLHPQATISLPQCLALVRPC